MLKIWIKNNPYFLHLDLMKQKHKKRSEMEKLIIKKLLAFYIS